MKHLVSIDDISQYERTALFRQADTLSLSSVLTKKAMVGKILANVFANPLATILATL